MKPDENLLSRCLCPGRKSVARVQAAEKNRIDMDNRNCGCCRPAGRPRLRLHQNAAAGEENDRDCGQDISIKFIRDCGLCLVCPFPASLLFAPGEFGVSFGPVCPVWIVLPKALSVPFPAPRTSKPRASV